LSLHLICFFDNQQRYEDSFFNPFYVHAMLPFSVHSTLPKIVHAKLLITAMARETINPVPAPTFLEETKSPIANAIFSRWWIKR
jgi:hypothetical protein